MTWEGWCVLAVVAALVYGLARNWPSDWVSIGCLAVLIAVGESTESPLLPTPKVAVSGFGEKVLVTVGSLFVVVTGLVQTGALATAARTLLRQPKTLLSAQVRLLLPVTALSAFLNNTPVVAMFMPIVEMIVQPSGPLVGQRIEEAGLRHLPGLFLAEIERADEILPAVAPDERLQANDRLIFVGIVESVVDLQRIRGLAPATNQVFKLNEPRLQRGLIEAVVSDRCPLAGRTIRDGQFRTRYDAAVLAVARSGERIRAKIGDIVLRPGDTLLLEAHRSFAQRMRNSGDFFLVSNIENSAPPRHEQSLIAVLILLAMIVVVTAGWFDMVTAALLAGAGMMLARCCTDTEARQSIDLRVLITIGASFGIARSMELSGAAEFLARKLVDGSQLQCNLMVFGPGGYRFTDYLRIGIPLDLLYFAVAVTLIPRVWPF